MKKDILTFALIVGAFVVGGTLMVIFEVLPEHRADEFNPLSAGNLTFESDFIIIREPLPGDDTRVYAVNEVAAKAVQIALEDDQVGAVMQQIQGTSVTVAGIQPTLLADSSGNLIHSSSGQVLITSNQERIDGVAGSGTPDFDLIGAGQAEAWQRSWRVTVNLDSATVEEITMVAYRYSQNSIQPNVIYASMNIFMPREVRVDPGTSVRWFNDSTIPHNVVGTYVKNSTSTSEYIDSGFFEKDRTFRFEFDEEGLFEYHCTIHTEEGMKGRLIISRSN